uniref:Uncharacterized protein n=1 Tax=Sinocyclocheilus grahami TaxID=75366 RepID=A0A672RLM3_SINGR
MFTPQAGCENESSGSPKDHSEKHREGLTSLLKHQPADVMDITAAVNQQTAASLKNQRLALEMANRLSVLAALNNTSVRHILFIKIQNSQSRCSLIAD